MKKVTETDALTMFRNALLSPGDQHALKTVREHSAEILEYLAVAEADRLPSEEQMLAIDCIWLGTVYEALSGGDMPLAGLEQAYVDGLFRAQVEDLQSVGRSFDETLFPSLPPDLRQFSDAFSDLTPLDTNARHDITSRADVAGFPHASSLAEFGITPQTILRATDSVAMLVERMIDRGLFRESQPILLSVDDAEQKPEYQHLSYMMAADEVRRATRSTPLFARSILRWCVGVAQYVPLFFDECEARPETRFGVTLRCTKLSEKNLFQRWSRGTQDKSEESTGDLKAATTHEFAAQL